MDFGSFSYDDDSKKIYFQSTKREKESKWKASMLREDDVCKLNFSGSDVSEDNMNSKRSYIYINSNDKSIVDSQGSQMKSLSEVVVSSPLSGKCVIQKYRDSKEYHPYN